MSHRLTDRERLAVALLPADRRYDYFVSKVVAEGQVWSLRNSQGWVVMSSEEGDECLPVWPYSEFAAEWISGEWADCSPASVPLDTWLERWTPGMERDGSMLAVFPNEAEEGIVVTPGELGDSLRAELDKQ